MCKFKEHSEICDYDSKRMYNFTKNTYLKDIFCTKLISGPTLKINIRIYHVSLSVFINSIPYWTAMINTLNASLYYK